MFKEISHTADIGLYVESTSYRNLFYDAAMGLMQISDIQSDLNDTRLFFKSYRNKAIDKETLLIDWLNFLVFQLDNQFYLINCSIKINRNYLKSMCCFKKFNKRNLLVKSATFHNLQLLKSNKLIKTKIIFDV